MGTIENANRQRDANRWKKAAVVTLRVVAATSVVVAHARYAFEINTARSAGYRRLLCHKIDMPKGSGNKAVIK